MNISGHSHDEDSVLLIKELDILSEWREFKIELKSNLINLSIDVIVKQLQSSPSYRYLKFLYEYYLAIPLTTEECERSFYDELN